MSKDVFKKISSLRNKLHKSLEKTGINSEQTRKISIEIDALVKEYYDSIRETEYPEYSDMYLYYKKSYEALKNITQQLSKFPTVSEWNKFAKTNSYLSHVSLEYIAKLNWKYLKIKVERELNLEN